MHLRKNVHVCRHLQCAFNKYGENNFKFEVIEYIKDKDKLLEIEQYWIDYFKSYDNKNGYNSRQIAESNLHTKRSEEFCKKNSEIRKGKKMSEETKEKIRIYQKGRKKSKETLEKMSLARRGEGGVRAKLKEKDVLNIKELIKNGYTNKQIAEIYNVDGSTISKIKTGISWFYLNNEAI
jgi:group I intron endonuclease